MNSLTIAYRNPWFRYIQYLIVTLIFEATFIYLLGTIELTETAKILLLVFSIHLSSVLFTAFLLLAYIHLKSPHYQIILDDEMLIVPRNSIIPDSVFIHFDSILFEGLFDQNTKYKIVFNGGSIIIFKANLRSKNDWDKVVYSIKSIVA